MACTLLNGLNCSRLNNEWKLDGLFYLMIIYLLYENSRLFESHLYSAENQLNGSPGCMEPIFKLIC